MQALGIDIGGTKIAAGLVDESGLITYRRIVATPAADGAAAILAAVIDLARSVLAAAGRAGIAVDAVGVGSAGHVDVTRGLITYASHNLPGWSGLSLRERLQAALDRPVFVDNDVNAMALGEHQFGAGLGFQEVLYVAVGTGIGGALVRNGELWRGTTWSAGEICHMVVNFDGHRRCSCGEMGHLEAYTCGPALAARYAELAGVAAAPDLRTVAARAGQGDEAGRRAIAEGATILGKALAGVLNLIDPEALVIGGGVPMLGTLWWEPFTVALRANPLPGPARVVLRQAILGTDAVMIGAAWLALTGGLKMTG